MLICQGPRVREDDASCALSDRTAKQDKAGSKEPLPVTILE